MKKKCLAAIVLACSMLFTTACDGDEPIGLNPNAHQEADEANKQEEGKKEEDKKEEKKNPNAPKFSEASGFYSGEISLTISCADSNAKIYYTLDGSKPTAESTPYNGSAIRLTDKSKTGNVLSKINKVNPSGDYFPTERVTKCNVVRAVAVLSNGEMIYNNATYFVDVDRDAQFEQLPIISMFTDSDNLFDYEKGIYVMGKAYDDWIAVDPSNKYKEGWQQEGNFSQKGKAWEREALIEYMPADGSKGFSQDVGIRIMGAASRRSMQKSFRIIAREDYGKKNIKYDLIPGNVRSDGSGLVEQYKSFVIRNGGNDNDFAKVRDPYLQSLVANRTFDTQQTTPCYVFIDGEFWGMYTITEDYSSHYIQNNYGIDDNDVVVVKRGEVDDGEDSDVDLYREMFDFICYNDMSDAANYKKAGEMLDLQNFAEYLSFMLYIYNQDSIFEGNNWSMWRSRTVNPDNAYADGKWRMLAFDTEYSTDIYGDGNGYKTNNISGVVNGEVKSSGDNRRPKDLLRSLLKNDEFKAMFINTLCDMRNVDFEMTRAVTALDSIVKLYKNGALKTYNRFGPDWVARYNPEGHYIERTSVLKTFMKGRYVFFVDMIKDSFSLGNAGSLVISQYDMNKGNVKVNNTELLTDTFEGAYFSECPVTISAKAKDGSKFKEFKVDGKSYTDETITITVNEKTNVEVVFE